MSKQVKSFLFDFIFEKSGRGYLLKGYNSPYKNSSQELDDIAVMLTGKDLKGKRRPEYQVLKLSRLKKGRLYQAKVECIYIEMKDGKFDQIFSLKELEIAR